MTNEISLLFNLPLVVQINDPMNMFIVPLTYRMVNEMMSPLYRSRNFPLFSHRTQFDLSTVIEETHNDHLKVMTHTLTLSLSHTHSHTLWPRRKQKKKTVTLVELLFERSLGAVNSQIISHTLSTFEGTLVGDL